MGRSEIKELTPGTAVHHKGKKRAQEILDTATDVLANTGYGSFTMRNIASKLGITLRNVQYYFNSKDILLEAVIEQRLRLDIVSAERVINESEGTAEERFLAFVDNSLEENCTPFIRGLQFEIWALANHNEFAATCRDHMTTTYSNFIYELIKPLNKGQSTKILRGKSLILESMLQGFALIEGSDIHIERKLGNLRKLFREEALRFVTTSD